MNFDLYIKEDYPGVVHIVAETQYQITSTFLRIQEYYESEYDNIRGQIFTLEEYMDTYAGDRGNFTYTTDWSGFNVPGNIVRSFYKHYKYMLNIKETTLFTELEYFLNRSDKFYVIGTHNENDEEKKAVIAHELCHAWYYIHEEYRNTTQQMVEDFPHRELISKGLRDMGYCDGTVIDEVQAYLSTSTTEELVELFYDEQKKYDVEDVMKHVRRFRKHFKTFKKAQDDEHL